MSQVFDLQFLQLAEQISQVLMQKEMQAQSDPQQSQKTVIMARTIKLQEECGELAEQILAKLGMQWNEKSFDIQNLQKELADVIITTIMLANACNIDLNEAVSTKFQMIQQRFTVNNN